MRRLPAIFLVLLVVLPGCAGFFSGSPPSPAPGESTTTVPDSVLPPGVDGRWLYNPDRLLAAHESALNGTNYRIRAHVTTNATERTSEWKRLDLRGRVGDGRVSVQATGFVPSIGSKEPYRFYRWNTSQAIRWSDASTKYSYTSYRWPDGTRSSLVDDRMKRILSLGDFLVTGTETRNGTEYVRLEANGSTDSNLSDFSATASVSEDGRIRTLSGSLTTNGGTDATAPSRVSFDYEFRTVASPPSRPDWVRNVPHLVLNRTGREKGIALHNLGGATVPKGTNLSFRVSGLKNISRNRLELSEPLRPGESAHFYTIRNEGEVKFYPSEREMLRGPDDGVVSLRERRVTVSGRISDVRFTAAVRPETRGFSRIVHPDDGDV